MLYPDPKNLSHAPLSNNERAFASYIKNNRFPCVGAKSALNQGGLYVLRARSFVSSWNDVALHQAIVKFAQEHGSNRDGFRSLAIIFDGPDHLSEKAYEACMWDRLQSWSDKDVWLGYDQDSAASADPDNPEFSLSFGGKAFFAVGLHPHASRKARRFSRPVIILNLHDQFEVLRAEGKYEGLRAAILARDKKLQGSINPMLARFGTSSEARQYSGRQVSEEWQCPYHRGIQMSEQEDAA